MIRGMIVEDEAIERRALQFLLEKYFKEEIEIVASVGNGQKAIEFEEHNGVDFILMDIQMPVKDGIEASRIIRQRNKDVQIIILTAYTEFEYARKAIDIGVFKYLLKPIENSEFVGAIDAVMQKIQKLPRSKKESQETKWSKRERSMKFMDKMKTYVLEHYERELSLEEVADHVGLPPNYLGKLFKKMEGLTFTDYLIELRMEKAKALLSSSEFSIKEITFMIGYTDPNYFSRAFKKYVGITATQYEQVLLDDKNRHNMEEEVK